MAYSHNNTHLHGGVGGDPILDEIDARVASKYTVMSKLGKGAYGIVWKATNNRDGETVALKKVFDAFQNATDAQRTFREVMFLQQMRGHENIVELHHVIKAENNRDLYLIFEYMETDLHAAIRANILQDIHKQYIIYQAYKALTYMHSAQLVHRDMKPANLLLNAECLMKVADFGLARSLSEAEGTDVGQPPPMMTDYIATRWYRAPEILVGSCKYAAHAPSTQHMSMYMSMSMCTMCHVHACACTCTHVARWRPMSRPMSRHIRFIDVATWLRQLGSASRTHASISDTYAHVVISI